MKNHYDEASVIRSLSRKSSIKINSIQKTIEVVKNNTEVGIGSWGKIDYLTKVHGYVVLFVKVLKNKPAKNLDNDNYNGRSNKTAKREAKFNMAAMAKSAMKKVKTQ